LLTQVAKIKQLKKQFDEFDAAMKIKKSATEKFKQLKAMEGRMDEAEAKVDDQVQTAVPAMTKWLDLVQAAWEIMQEEQRQKAVLERVIALLREHITTVKARKREYEKKFNDLGVSIDWDVSI